ncbi:CdiA C-terminal domain-containing protein [Aestuariispira ectoiniformans]|uniref:CdiA C-terminal domain-containing protein n=1 Tax=Aestuariispira ectoiniformans TaxID=2775080 RepID=UPI00223B4D1F|nr:hypothetical protein [Aestuariispira ectoiniformans]
MEQNPIVDGPKNPDFRIDGKIYDNYAPETSSPRNIWKVVNNKVTSGQADNIVLNLADSDIDIEVLRRQFDDWPIDGLNDLKIISSDGYLGNL